MARGRSSTRALRSSRYFPSPRHRVRPTLVGKQITTNNCTSPSKGRGVGEGRLCTRMRASTLTRRWHLRFGFSMDTPHVHRPSEPKAIVAYDRTERRKGRGNRGNVEVAYNTQNGCIKMAVPPLVVLNPNRRNSEEGFSSFETNRNRSERTFELAKGTPS